MGTGAPLPLYRDRAERAFRRKGGRGLLLSLMMLLLLLLLMLMLPMLLLLLLTRLQPLYRRYALGRPSVTRCRRSLFFSAV